MAVKGACSPSSAYSFGKKVVNLFVEILFHSVDAV
jgi:hypothetical protein